VKVCGCCAVNNPRRGLQERSLGREFNYRACAFNDARQRDALSAPNNGGANGTSGREKFK
jgi:hypothetical protein